MKSWFLLRRETPPVEDFTPLNDAAPSFSDEELLRKFVIERDDRAFALLVGRHSGLVFGVCRRVLGMQHDAEDAFQAVFLILARKANSLRCGGSLPAWLHKTAFRTALRARAARSRRREQSTEGYDMIAHNACAQIASDHDGSIVDEELNRLPERYRLPLYLCCIEGHSLEAAARRLGWSVGSVKGRLERGRSELRRRLLLRRVPFAFGVVAATMSALSAQAAAPVAPSLIASTVQAGMQHAVGRSALGYVSQHALHLAQGSWKIMSLTTLKITVCSVTLTGLMVWGGSHLPSPAAAEGTNGGAVVLEASLPSSAAFESQLALADEREQPKPDARREGDRPREGEQPRREGEQPRREGEQPRREGDAPRSAPREGGETRRPETREGDRPRPAAEGERRSPLEGFKPQTEREEALMKMIMQLQAELASLRRTVQMRDAAGREGAVRREGEPGPRREGDAPRPEGARDGDKPRTGPRDGETPKAGPRDGEAPRREGEAVKRDGEAPKREGDAPKKD